MSVQLGVYLYLVPAAQVDRLGRLYRTATKASEEFSEDWEELASEASAAAEACALDVVHCNTLFDSDAFIGLFDVLRKSRCLPRGLPDIGVYAANDVTRIAGAIEACEAKIGVTPLIRAIRNTNDFRSTPEQTYRFYLRFKETLARASGGGLAYSIEDGVWVDGDDGDDDHAASDTMIGLFVVEAGSASYVASELAAARGANGESIEERMQAHQARHRAYAAATAAAFAMRELRATDEVRAFSTVDALLAQHCPELYRGARHVYAPDDVEGLGCALSLLETRAGSGDRLAEQLRHSGAQRGGAEVVLEVYRTLQRGLSAASAEQAAFAIIEI